MIVAALAGVAAGMLAERIAPAAAIKMDVEIEHK
jgi:hypothetical protein